MFTERQLPLQFDSPEHSLVASNFLLVIFCPSQADRCCNGITLSVVISDYVSELLCAERSHGRRKFVPRSVLPNNCQILFAKKYYFEQKLMLMEQIIK